MWHLSFSFLVGALSTCLYAGLALWNRVLKTSMAICDHRMILVLWRAIAHKYGLSPAATMKSRRRRLPLGSEQEANVRLQSDEGNEGTKLTVTHHPCVSFADFRFL